jgi:hypothetical protein
MVIAAAASATPDCAFADPAITSGAIAIMAAGAEKVATIDPLEILDPFSYPSLCYSVIARGGGGDATGSSGRDFNPGEFSGV